MSASSLPVGSGSAAIWAGVTSGYTVVGADVEARINRVLSAYAQASAIYGKTYDWRVIAGIGGRW